jgi:putative thiamine transport system permease protein
MTVYIQQWFRLYFMKRRQSSRLGWFPVLTQISFLSAIVIGLLSTWIQAFGYLPAIGFHQFSMTPWISFFEHPSTVKAITATLISGWGATFFSLVITFSLFTLSYNNRYWQLLQKSLAPLLSVPHAAFAIGFLFLAAPSGWILRLISPELTGFHTPPDWNIMKDGYGISLMVVLVIKEVPFLILISLSALSRINVNQSIAVGRSLGYETTQVWIKIIIPQLYPKIRLSVYAVLAYSLSVVDIAQILGPTLPPTLAVQVFRWFNDPDVVFRLTGAAGATFILFLVMASIGLIFLLEKGVRWLLKFWLTTGKRHSNITTIKLLSNLSIITLVGITLFAIALLIIWSLTWRWQFPDVLPKTWSLKFWQKGFFRLGEPLLNTFTTGLISAFIAVLLVIGCLENELILIRQGRKTNIDKLLWLIYLPLLVPQIAFLFGVQVLLVILHLDGIWISLVWSHLLFVLPYTFLTLGPIYRSYDQRMTDVAITLSGSPWKAFIKVKLPMLLRPVLFSSAVGFSVSVAQYLPTLFIGAGRFDTITTEAVNLASGSDRRIVAVYALYQLLTPLLIFMVALWLPRLYFYQRKDMQI